MRNLEDLWVYRKSDIFLRDPAGLLTYSTVNGQLAHSLGEDNIMKLVPRTALSKRLLFQLFR